VGGPFADQAACRFPRQPVAAIERNDVADAGGKLRRTPSTSRKTRILGSAQQPIQLVQAVPVGVQIPSTASDVAPEAAAVQQEENGPLQ